MKDQNHEYNVENGMTGMLRDIIIKLIGIIKKVEKIRVIIGMCANHYQWKEHNFFSSVRKQVSYIENSHGKFMLNGENNLDVDFLINEKCTYRTICVDVSMTFGMWRMSFCIHNNTSSSSFRFGIVYKDDVDRILTQRLGSDFNKGAACLLFAHKVAMANNDQLIVELDRFRHRSPDDGTAVVAAMEVDMENRALYFFVNKKQLYSHIVHIPSIVHFAFSSGSGQEKVRNMHMQKISRLTRPNADYPSIPFEWQARPL